jgi:DNA-binding NarL/FixJ family response regulator
LAEDSCLTEKRCHIQRLFFRQAPIFHHLPGAVRTTERSATTDREQDVLGLVARGLTNAEIATELFITLATVKTHVSRLLTKLAARDRAQLIVIAYESGFVTGGVRLREN